MPNQQDIALFYYKQKRENISSQYPNGILEQMNQDLAQLYQNDFDGVIYKYNLDESSSLFFLDQGIVTKDKINLLMNHEKIQDNGKNIEINNENLNFWYQNSFTIKFFTIIENNLKLKQSNFNESWFNKNNISNYQATGQLQDFLTDFNNQTFLNQLNQTTNNTFKLKELQEISNLVHEEFINYYLVKSPFGSGQNNGMPSGSGFFHLLPNQEVANTVNINEGQRLFTRILTRSVSYYDINRTESLYYSPYLWDLNEFNNSYNTFSKANISLKFIANPFNALLGGSLYSGIDAFINDSKINNSYFPLDWDFLKTLSVRQLKIDFTKNPEAKKYISITNIKQSKKLLSIGWLYSTYLIFQGLIVGITFIFNTKKAFLSKKKLKNNPETKKLSDYLYQ